MLISEMEHNMSDYDYGSASIDFGFETWEEKNNMSDIVPFFDVVKIWSNYADINDGPSHPLIPRNSYDGPGDLENRGINGSAGIWPTINSADDLPSDSIVKNIINSLVAITCLSGLVGNGMVIWLLGFRIKRNPFTTYVLNLSIADFGSLIFLISTAVSVTISTQYNRDKYKSLWFSIFLELFFFTYSTGQFLLAAISIDRCVAILFPLWHRCHRPPYLSTSVCALIWIVCFFLSGIHFTLHKTLGSSLLWYPLIVNVALCTPVMVASTLTLFIYIWYKSKQHQRGKLITAILLALLFFLIFAFPLNIFYIINHYHGFSPNLMVAGFACASLNSSINPLIYFLVGRRQKKGQPRASMKVALQRVFKDERDCKEEEKRNNGTLA